MVSFIKSYHIDSIKKKLIILYILNVTDIVFTLLLLKTGYFAEVNILMAGIVENPPISLGIKLLVPALLFLLIFFRIGKADIKQLRFSNLLINIVLFLYLLINISHVLWTILYLLLKAGLFNQLI